MSLGRPESQLQVAEITGVTRGGKGTLVKTVVESREGVASEETGLDYRALTRFLERSGIIEVDMPDDVMTRAVMAVDSRMFVSALARKAELITEVGRKSLYADDIEAMVSNIGSVPDVRTAVKDGFKTRVEAVRDSGDYNFLLVDGRNLAPVVREIDDVDLCFRAFVKCNATEAAWRQTEAAGLSIATPAGEEAFRSHLASVRSRNKRDGSRAIDPVRTDPRNNIYSYWAEPWRVSDTVVLMEAVGADIDALGLTEQRNVGVTGGKFDTFFYCPDPEAAADAAIMGRQLLFDTAPFRMKDPRGEASVAAMNQAVLEMFDYLTSAVLVH